MRSIFFTNLTSEQRKNEKSDKISSFIKFSQKKHNHYLKFYHTNEARKTIKILNDDDDV
jgi:hypothetical protein